MKKFVSRQNQPVILLLTFLFCGLAHSSLTNNSWKIVVASSLTMALILAPEFVNERHVGWRRNKEFFVDLFDVLLSIHVIAYLVTKLADEPLGSTQHMFGSVAA